MTTVDRLDNGRRHVLKVTGHAGYAQEGEPDIVCAAISALSCTLLQCLADEEARGGLTVFSYTQEGGNVEVDALATHGAAARVAVMFEMARTGFAMLADTYPAHVTIKAT